MLARVRGSRFTPYRVRIRPQSFSEHQWRRAEKAIAAQASTLARLLAGEMPDDIEEVLAGAKLTLLPTGYDELRVTCTCPDTANPCKHVAAVYYTLAERFDADPFALLTLRGRTEDELLDDLRARRARATGRRVSPTAGADADAAGSPTPALIDALDDFWRAGPELGRLEVTPLAVEYPDALLRRLEPLRRDGDGAELAELLAPAYALLAAGAERRALAD